MKRQFASLAFAFIILTALAAFRPARAQMQTGPNMKDFDKIFGVKSFEREYAFQLSLLSLSAPGGVYFPGQQPRVSFQIRNNRDQALRVAGKVEVIPYGTRGLPGDIWKPEVFSTGKISALPIEVNIDAKGFADFTVNPPVPQRMGGYALVVDLGAAGRRFLASYVRTFPARNERVQYPSQSLEYMPPEVLERLDVQAVRLGVSYNASGTEARKTQMKELAAQLKTLHDHKVTCVVEIGAGQAPQPLGRGRPHLTKDGVMKSGKEDLVWSPSQDDDYQQFVYEVAAQYGWPKGPVTGFMLWNEPWEGLSISGWQSDMLRYRELYKRMGEAIFLARREAKVEVLIGGADSSSNTWDKFFPEGIDKSPLWPQYLDFVSIHYQGMNAPVLYPEWNNRKWYQGRVKIWDTESWVANTDDRFAGVVASNRAAGYDRAMGIYGGNVVENVGWGGRAETQKIRTPDGEKEVTRPVFAWSPAASVGAVRHFLGERAFNRILFPKGLPWVYVFDGLNQQREDGTVVVLGDLGNLFDNPRQMLFRTVSTQNAVREHEEITAQLAQENLPDDERARLTAQLRAPSPLSGAALSLADGGGRFQLFDFYGNPVAPQNGRITIPLDMRGFFLRGDGKSGSFNALLNALQSARIEGMEPLEIIPHDFLAPIADKPTLRLQLTNVLNRTVRGDLTLRVEGLTLSYPQRIVMPAHSTRTIAVKVLGGRTAPDNAYPLSARFDGGADGIARHEETMRANVIARKTIVVDGDLSDWNGVLPQTVSSAEGATRTLTEAAWLPMVPFAAGKAGGQASGFVAYDANNFYFGAKIADDTPEDGTLRFATRDDEQFFYPKTSYEIDAGSALRQLEEPIANADANDKSLLQNPASVGRVANRWVNDVENGIFAHAIDIEVPDNAPRRVAIYLPPGEFPTGQFHPNGMTLRLLDENGKQLDEQFVRDPFEGVYALYQISGKKRIVIRGNGDWYRARLGGVFFDVAPEAKASESRFEKFDFDTHGDWKTVYGAQGYTIPGLAAKTLDAVKIGFPENVEKKTHVWPDGVRQFSYRKWPILPAGNGSPGFDNVQIAFNAIPVERDEWLTHLPGRPPQFIWYKDTDYEYALNKVAPEYGGGAEVWRLQVPGMPRKQFYPRQPKAAGEGAVTDAKLVTRHEGNTRVVEAAIPWREIPDVKKLLDARQPLKFSFRVNNGSGGPILELAKDRSVSRTNSPAFHVDWVEHWANEIEFGWGR